MTPSVRKSRLFFLVKKKTFFLRKTRLVFITDEKTVFLEKDLQNCGFLDALGMYIYIYIYIYIVRCYNYK